mmetsp:Transcript_20112/g.32382  ORF Transcript_20112/g.32382 Transcript_20112/m.32382 type:complete len:219 (+) Transcript_20112:725-1381(+)
MCAMPKSFSSKMDAVSTSATGPTLCASAPTAATAAVASVTGSSIKDTLDASDISRFMYNSWCTSSLLAAALVRLDTLLLSSFKSKSSRSVSSARRKDLHPGESGIEHWSRSLTMLDEDIPGKTCFIGEASKGSKGSIGGNNIALFDLPSAGPRVALAFFEGFCGVRANGETTMGIGAFTGVEEPLLAEDEVIITLVGCSGGGGNCCCCDCIGGCCCCG